MPAPWPSIILLRASASPSPHQFPMTLALFSIVWGCHTLSMISKSQRPAYVTHRSNEDERTLLGLVHLALERWLRSFHPQVGPSSRRYSYGFGPKCATRPPR